MPVAARACQRTPQTSTSHALDSSVSLIMLITGAGHHARFSSSEVQHCTALICRCVVFIQSSITAPSFAIFSSAAAVPSWKHISGCIAASLRGFILIFHAADATEDLREIEGLDRDAAALRAVSRCSEPC